jgi:hypothetical protein
MSIVNYPNTSPYYSTPQLDWRLGRYVHHPIPADSKDVLVTISPTYHQRPDRLSYDTYGTTDYWWVFMVRNMNAIRDPIYDMVQGMTIYVPSLAAIQKAMAN